MESKNNNSPDYSQYSIAELEDVLAHIDQVKYPERYTDAKASLADKLEKRKALSASDEDKPLILPPKPKWAELHLMTRVMVVIFTGLSIAILPTMFTEFMTSKSWAKYSSWPTWIMACLLVTGWFVSLQVDAKYRQNLVASNRGKLGVVVMPIVLIAFNWLFIEKALPSYLHSLSAQKEVQYYMNYRKQSGEKFCRYRLKVLESDDFESGNLCISESQLNSLPEAGEIHITGSRSQFGIVVNSFVRSRIGLVKGYE
ncbi:hypothetical protein [Paraglaciecola sp. 2405UD69-4]|uniref:hypothetical protein n=1 Tax=Paraglaciecola sp. 2405UD69-4 TaxID=3391836 RepID=UPI0039C91030